MSIVLWEVPDFIVDQHVTQNIDASTGVPSISFDGPGQSLGKLPLLFDKNGSGIGIVNTWLIHLKANLRRKSVNTQAQGLLHYFTFLNDLQMEWDEMPIPIRLRPTYLFRKHLRDAYKSGSLAKSTANSYMRVVINFYKFYLEKNHYFEHPPFKYEKVRIDPVSSHKFMKASYAYVDTTDLRLKLPNDTSYYGVPRKLVPLNDNEWQTVKKHYSYIKKAISKRSNYEHPVSISREFQIAIELSRFSGLRRKEITTLRTKSIFNPNSEQINKKYLIHNEGLNLDPRMGIETKNSSVRRAEILTTLMLELHKYINTARYINRRDLYIALHPENKDNPPLLISQNGHEYSEQTLNARWGELRNAVRKEIPSFNHKFHNLRSTYAVERLKELLNSGIKEGKALDYLQSVMGHKNRATLLGYLRFCEDNITADEVYETALNIVLAGGE
jgi:integrase